MPLVQDLLIQGLQVARLGRAMPAGHPAEDLYPFALLNVIPRHTEAPSLGLTRTLYAARACLLFFLMDFCKPLYWDLSWGSKHQDQSRSECQ